jgi:hypothetical protein
MNWNLFFFALIVLTISYYMYYITKDVEYVQIFADIIKCSCNIYDKKLKCNSILKYSFNNKEYTINLTESYCDFSNNSKRKLWINPLKPEDYATNSYQKIIYPLFIAFSVIGLITSLFI